MKERVQAGSPLMPYELPIRPDVDAVLKLPRDMTPREAERVCAFVHALVMPEAPPKDELAP